MTFSGSPRQNSSNSKLLRKISTLRNDLDWQFTDLPSRLPLYLTQRDVSPWPNEVTEWRQLIKEADAIVISSPEYLHNLPANLKNALECLTTSGELMSKPVFPITFTPHSPRGEKAMKSLLWSLEALNARVVAHLDLYQSEVKIDQKLDLNTEELLCESLNILIGAASSV